MTKIDNVPLLSAAPLASSQRRQRAIRGSGASFPATRAILLAVLVVGALVWLTPFVFMLSTSLKTEIEAATGTLNLWPKGGPQWSNYLQALSKDHMDFWPALANTVVITTWSVVGQVLSSSLVGFGFARFRFPGRNALFIIMLTTLMLPAQVTMIPTFVLFRSMGLIDTIWPLVIPAWLASPFFVFMFRQFFAQVPEELVEAARLDGASNWRIYWQIMLPLSGPVVAVAAVYTFLAAWNDYLGPLIYLNSPQNRTLALALDAFRGQYGVRNIHLLMAGSVITMLPCILLFFCAQRYFVESVAATGLKA